MSDTTMSNMAASSRAGQPAKSGCTDCDYIPDVNAVILYPSLGTPLVLAPGQTRCSIVVATDAAGVAAMGIDDVGEATSLYQVVDRHLRLVGISEKKTTDDTTQGNLFGDGKSYGKASKFISGRYLGKMRLSQQITPFVMIDVDWNLSAKAAEETKTDKALLGDMAFSISPQAATLYQNTPFVVQVNIDLTAEPFTKITDSAFMSFAWMIKQAKPSAALSGTHVHCNDVVIAAFRAELSKADHFKEWVEFDVTKPKRDGMPDPKPTGTKGIWSWHPVIRSKATGQLKLGHLSDVHINIRQNVLAESKASVLEGIAECKPVGSKVSNCLEALKNLFDQFGSGAAKADALVITGDLIDFNRNLCPAKAQGDIRTQWSAFNVVNNVMDHRVYPRGQDDMLMFSLVRYAYTDLKLPVFLTSGNHEAYQVPYGISPRVQKVRDVARAFSEEPGLSYIDAVTNMKPDYKVGLNEYAERKANAGISADHNMTIFEAALAYGPTYAQVILTENFNNTQFDWFYALFTPLNNWCIFYGADSSKPRQALVGLGWGDAENYKNSGNLNLLDSDNQGLGILPRSVDGISVLQQQIITAARNRKIEGAVQSLSVFSHFTLINYGGTVALNTKNATLPVKNGAFEAINTGTCQQNQAWYFTNCVNTAKAVDYHFSGHSHRAGVYHGAIDGKSWNPLNPSAIGNELFKVTSALEPGIVPRSLGKRGQTALIVSSSGGPIGVQNYAGELAAGDDSWTLRPPSGTLVDPNTHTVQRVAVNTDIVKASKPRLCVALDYVHLEKRNALRFDAQTLASPELPTTWNMVLGKQFRDLNCIAGVKFWVFQTRRGAGVSRGTVKSQGWTALSPHYMHSGIGASIAFNEADMKLLKSAVAAQSQARNSIPMFAEVALREPNNAALQTQRWVNEMNCEDAWLFPVTLTSILQSAGDGWAEVFVHTLERPAGELGEIPMWMWLHTSNPSKYPNPDGITDPSKGKT